MKHAEQARFMRYERRAQLLNIALNIARRDRRKRITLAEVAKAAGVSRSLIKHHFHNQATLRGCIESALTSRQSGAARK